MINYKTTFPFLLLLTVWLASCEKKYLEIVPVLQVEQDLSIPGANDVKYFSFPSEQIGYAAENASFIYKTSDGGKSWLKLAVGNASNPCRGMEFFDTLNGMCLMGENVYVTDNGGLSWTYRGSGQFMGISTTGKGIMGFSTRTSCSILVSTNKGKSFQLAGNIKLDREFEGAIIAGTKVFVLENDQAFRSLSGFDVETRNQEELVVFGRMNNPAAMFYNEYSKALVGSSGQILQPPSPDESYQDAYFGHTYTYFSVDGYQDLLIAVGERTASINRQYGEESKWSELLDRDGRSFPFTFFKIKFINENTFYLSGNNGLLWRAKI